jgi:KUP system potassium uptake protein
VIDSTFLSANILKIPDGGWVPLAIGIVIFTLMLTWKTGRNLLLDHLKNDAMQMNAFITAITPHPPIRVSGTGVFMTPNPDGVPHALLHNLKHNKVLHEKVVILTVKFLDYPHVIAEDRVEFEALPHNFFKVSLRYGFKDQTDIPTDLLLCALHGLSFDAMDTSYFLGKESLIANQNPNMSFWRKKIFIGLFKSAETITQQFKLPPNRVVELGTQISF